MSRLGFTPDFCQPLCLEGFFLSTAKESSPGSPGRPLLRVSMTRHSLANTSPQPGHKSLEDTDHRQYLDYDWHVAGLPNK